MNEKSGDKQKFRKVVESEPMDSLEVEFWFNLWGVYAFPFLLGAYLINFNRLSRVWLVLCSIALATWFVYLMWFTFFKSRRKIYYVEVNSGHKLMKPQKFKKVIEICPTKGSVITFFLWSIALCSFILSVGFYVKHFNETSRILLVLVGVGLAAFLYLLVWILFSKVLKVVKHYIPINNDFGRGKDE